MSGAGATDQGSELPTATAWTGGQYSLFRATFGVYLAVHFAMLVPWAAELFSSDGILADGMLSPLLHAFPNVLALVDAPAVVTGFVALGAVAAIAFGVGWHDRIAAVLMWYVLACTFGRNPLIANPSLPFVGWMLLAHACLPPAPFGSLAARGRTDPGGGWTFPRSLFAAAWIVMALGYSYSGYTKLVSPSWTDGTALARVLENPLARPTFIREAMLALPERLLQLATWGGLGLELLFAPLALVRRARPWLWLSMLAMHLTLIVLIDFADLSLGMVMLHAFTFNPRWIAPRAADTRDVLFYDGDCGLCHGAVRFVLAEDQTAAPLCVATLGGATFEDRLSDEQREALPDSLVLATADGEILTRSDGVLRLLERLGGAWRVIAVLGRFVPRPLRDGLYDGIARIRKRVFAAPNAACPILPPHLRARFVD